MSALLDSRFQKLKQQYQRLKQELAAQKITQEQFREALEQGMIEHEGRWWMIGLETGRWYVNEDNTWVEAEPPREIAAGGFRSVLPADADKGKPDWSGVWIVGGLAMIGFLIGPGLGYSFGALLMGLAIMLAILNFRV